MKGVISVLKFKAIELKNDLTNNPMNQDERLRKVVALEKIDDAIKLLSSIDL